MNTRRLHGRSGPVRIVRDAFGIPHVRAGSAADAWFGMGYACATDRLFQMDYDRRRATGRWAEVAGRAAVPADALARRLGLADAARADLQVMSDGVRSAFDSYARGVNEAITAGGATFESAALGYRIEDWQPWHSVAAFKVRHVLMGLWQHKLAQAVILARGGRSALSRLDIRVPLGAPLAVPPGGRVRRLYDRALADIAATEPYLGFLAEVEPGSNAWAVSGARTAHGAAVLCNDSHRALDTPNVYWQCQVSCPEFDVIGATFAGLPGFPHFGHNGRVAWAITHAAADTQDLYLEWFDADRPGRYRVPDGWAEADLNRETIQVRDGQPVEIEVWRTRHGPVVHGDPRRGMALALTYTATRGPTRGFEPMLAMLAATDVEQLIDSQREWVDPVNNLLAADTGGRIAYQTRGLLPVRDSTAHRRLPVAGWTGECEWVGTVPFERMPRVVDPDVGFLMTANNVIVDGDEPYISYSFADPFRAERIRERLAARRTHTLADLAGMQADTVSWAARAWGDALGKRGPFPDGTPAESARRLLAAWDGDLAPESARALLYGCFRRCLAEELLAADLGAHTWDWIVSDAVPAAGVLVRRCLANDTWRFLGGPVPPGAADGGGDRTAGTGSEPAAERAREQAIERALAPALARAWSDACAMAGPDPDTWRWDDHHRLVPRHPLAALLDHAGTAPQPAPLAMGGDADTIQAASYGWRRRSAFTVTGLSVYRQVVDMADPGQGRWVIPGGASGDPRGGHFADQLPVWGAHRLVPMLYRAADLRTAPRDTAELWPDRPRSAHTGQPTAGP